MSRRNAATVPDDVRHAVVTRDESKCQRCGMWVANIPSSLQHRKPRGMGGRKGAAAVASYDMSNLILVCGSATTPGSCHEEIERDRAQAYDDGWLVRENEDPATVPVLTCWGWRHYDETWRDA